MIKGKLRMDGFGDIDAIFLNSGREVFALVCFIVDILQTKFWSSLLFI